MKNIFLLATLFLLSCKFCFAQEEFKFSEIVKTDSLKAEVLSSKGKAWIISHKFSNVDTSSASGFKGDSWYRVYQKGVVSKQMHGTITYKLLLEIKDNKYRYTFTDFVFHYHKQDRNLVMVPTGKTKSLNDPKAEGWQKTWEKHKAYSKKQMEVLIADLKKSMEEPQKAIIKKEEEF
jgi:hypothetical protein